MTIKVFGTSNKSINEEINYLGVSPCPESLQDYSFFHQYEKLFLSPISNFQLNITTTLDKEQAAFSNFDYKSEIWINEDRYPNQF